MGPELNKKNDSLAERIRQRNVKEYQNKFFKNKLRRQQKAKRR